MTAKRQCFWIPPGEPHDMNGYVPSLVTEGEPGHAPLTGSGPGSSPWYWGKTYELARRIADEENQRMFGLNPQEAIEIVLSSMSASKARQPGG